jgi:uncharacterized protein YdaU (DUF1376 family)
VTEQTTHVEAVKKRLDEERATREKAHAEHREAQSAVKPTPTQAENDAAAMGVHVLEHEHDGSPTVDPNAPQSKQSEPAKRERGGYQTRAATPST